MRAVCACNDVSWYGEAASCAVVVCAGSRGGRVRKCSFHGPYRTATRSGELPFEEM